MAKNLIIVESPSKATTIKKYLGTNYKVLASVGHVRDLPKSKLGVDLENNFEPQYINIRGKGPLINELKKEAKNAENVYLATDPDREGEAIAWHLAYILGIDEDEKCRVTFNEITKNTVKEAVKEPRTLDLNLIDAQQARRVLDRIVGYKISPLLWAKVKKGLSAGRVQSVAVKLICDREEEINNFIPEEYWNINANFKKDDKEFTSRLYAKNGKKIDIKNKEEVDGILKDLDKNKYLVTDCKKATRKRNPAAPFTTSTMQQEASRKLGFPIKKTMSLAQKLYEHGLITYMRTDSTRISEEAREAAKLVIVGKYGEENFENRYYKTKASSQDAHEGIRPTNIVANQEEVVAKLKRDEQRLYKLIYNRFIASLMASAVYNTVTVEIEAKGNNSNEVYNFRANGQTLVFNGFMSLYIEGKDEKSEEDDESKLPELVQGEELKLKDITSKQSFTEPPARYTEASLVKTLEEKGIGRPSTYASIVTTILTRDYIEKEQKQLKPTELGIIVNDLLVENFKDIMNVEFTANVENRLDNIAEGNEKWKELIKEFYEPFAKDLEKAEATITEVEIKDEVSDVPCELCGRMMVIKSGRYGKFLACPGYPECKNTKPIIEKVEAPCPVCGSEVLVRKTKRGRKFYVCSSNTKENPNNCIYISWNEPKVGEVFDVEKQKARNERIAKAKEKKAQNKKTKK